LCILMRSLFTNEDALVDIVGGKDVG
jgi:hypothetical protein